MPVRLTPTKSLLISYDSESDSWVTLEGVSLCLLSQYVDIEPGVTVEHVFKLIDRDAALKHFLAEYCSCDLDAIRVRQPVEREPIEVITEIEVDEDGHRIPKNVTSVDTVAVLPFFYVFTDVHTGERRLEGKYMLSGKSSQHHSCYTGFGGSRSVTYSEIKDFFVALDTEMNVSECDEDKCSEDDAETIAFSANVRYTLLDVLACIVGHFGEPVFDPRYQKEIDYENEMWERYDRENNGPEVNDE